MDKSEEDRALSIVLHDEKTGDAVRIEVSKESGMAGLSGRGDLLNWFCLQVPQFMGVFDNSLPDGRHIHVRVSDTEKRKYTVGSLDNLSLPDPTTLRHGGDG